MFAAGGELIDEAGGEGSVGWRKPPGPNASEAEVMRRGGDGMRSRWFAVGKVR